jgi:3-oxoacyl-[acyl-carrier-protein] synthase II
MGQRRVVVSGVGVVSALGNGRDEFWSALASGRSGIAPLTSVERTGLGFDQLAEARAFDPAATRN